MKLDTGGRCYRLPPKLPLENLLQWTRGYIQADPQYTEKEEDIIIQTVRTLMLTAESYYPKGSTLSKISIHKQQVDIYFTVGSEKHSPTLIVSRLLPKTSTTNPTWDSGVTQQPTPYARWKTNSTAEYMKHVPNVEEMLNYMTELLDTCKGFQDGIRASSPSSRIGGDTDERM